MPATEELSAGFLEGEGDLELRVAGREVDRLHREVADVEGVAALTDEEDGDPLLVDARHLLHREADLEERRATRVADGVEAVDEAGERILLVLEGAVHAAAVRGEVIGDGEILGDDATERHGIDEIPDAVAEFLLGASRQRHADDEVLLPTIAVHEEVVSREQGREEGDAVFLRKSVDFLGEVAVELEAEGRSVEGLHGRARTIGRQIDRGGGSGEVILPEFEHLVPCPAREVGLLPLHEVGVGRGDGLDLGSASGLGREVVFDEILDHHRDRPRVGDDVVHAEQRDVGVVGGAEELETDDGTTLEIEGTIGVLADERLELDVVEGGAVVLAEVDGAALVHDLHGLAAAGDKGRVNERMPLEEKGKGLLHRHDVEERTELAGEDEIVGRRIGRKAVEEPEGFLSLTEREDLGHFTGRLEGHERRSINTGAAPLTSGAATGLDELLEHGNGKVADVRPVQDRTHGHGHAEFLLDAVHEFDRHERVEAEVGERGVLVETRGVGAKDGADLRGDEVLDHAEAFLGGSFEDAGGHGVAATCVRAGHDIEEHIRARDRGAEAREGAPVTTGRAKLDGIGRHPESKEVEGLIHVGRTEADHLEILLGFLVARDETGAFESPPVEGQGGQAEGTAVMRELVEEDVASVVVRLLHGTDDGGEGGEGKEMLERDAEGGLVEIPRAQHLRQEDLVEAGLVELDDEFVIEDHGPVDHADERRATFLDLSDDAVEVGARGDVAAGVDDLDSGGAEFLDLL